MEDVNKAPALDDVNKALALDDVKETPTGNMAPYLDVARDPCNLYVYKAHTLDDENKAPTLDNWNKTLPWPT